MPARLALGLLLVAVSRLASADAPASSTLATAWQRLYPGFPQVIDPRVSPLPLLDLGGNRDTCLEDPRADACATPATRCSSKVNELLRLVAAYDSAARVSDDAGAGTLGEEIETFLFKGIGEKNECFAPVARAYVVRSVALYEPPGVDPKMIRPGPAPSLGRLLAYVAAALSNTGKIRFIPTGGLNCAGPTDDSKEPTIPAQPSRKLIGAYECKQSVIYLDARLRPFDLGATFIHELDHLMRDKERSSLIRDEFTDKKGKIDWIAYLLYDETLATSHAAFSERNMSFPRITRIEPKGTHELEGFRKVHSGAVEKYTDQPTPYQLSSDLSQVRRDGVFSQLWGWFAGQPDAQTFLQAYFTDKFSGVMNNFGDDPRKSSARHGLVTVPPSSTLANDTWDLVPWTKLKGSLESLWRLVFDFYFPGGRISRGTQTLLDPIAHRIEVSALGNWIARNLDGSDRGTATPLSLEELVLEIDRVIADTASPSDSCSLFISALKGREDPSITKYLGNEATDACPIRPGGEGVKGDRGLRPCLWIDHGL